MKVFECFKLNNGDEVIVKKSIMDELKQNVQLNNLYDLYVNELPDGQYKIKFVNKGEPENDPDWVDVTPDEWKSIK
jgi:hypothetical protein